MNYKIYQYTFIIITTLIIFLALNFISEKTKFIKSKKDYLIVLTFAVSDHSTNDERVLNFVIHDLAKENLLVQTIENNRDFLSVKYKFEINDNDQDITEKFEKNLKYVEQNKLKIIDTYVENIIQKIIHRLNLKLVKDFDLNKINNDNIKLTWENLKCSKLYMEINKYDKNEIINNMGLAQVCKNINDLDTLMYIKSNNLSEDILIHTMIEYNKQLLFDIKEIEKKDLTEKTLSYYLKIFIYLIIGFIISQLLLLLLLQLKLSVSKK